PFGFGGVSKEAPQALKVGYPCRLHLFVTSAAKATKLKTPWLEKPFAVAIAMTWAESRRQRKLPPKRRPRLVHIRKRWLRLAFMQNRSLGTTELLIPLRGI